MCVNENSNEIGQSIHGCFIVETIVTKTLPRLSKNHNIFFSSSQLEVGRIVGHRVLRQGYIMNC